MTGHTTFIVRARHGRGQFAVPYLRVIVKESFVTLTVPFDHLKYTFIVASILDAQRAGILEGTFSQDCGDS